LCIGSKVLGSALPLAAEAAVLIEKVTPALQSFIQAPPLAASVQSNRKRNSEKANVERFLKLAYLRLIGKVKIGRLRH